MPLAAIALILTGCTSPQTQQEAPQIVHITATPEPAASPTATPTLGDTRTRTADGFHLTYGSAAMDQGVNAGVTADFDGESRPQGGGYDLGADELRSWDLCLPLVVREDLDRNGTVTCDIGAYEYRISRVYLPVVLNSS